MPLQDILTEREGERENDKEGGNRKGGREEGGREKRGKAKRIKTTLYPNHCLLQSKPTLPPDQPPITSRTESPSNT